MTQVAVLWVLAIAAVFTVPAAATGGPNIYNISYGEHRPIYVDIELLSLTEIDGASQTFNADFFLSQAYQDNTHAVHTAPDQETQATYDRVDIEFVNSQAASEQYRFVYASWEKPSIVEHFNSSIPDVVGIPWIRVESRMQGTFKVNLGLQDFPFDQQKITMEMESPNHEIHHGEFVVDTHSDMLGLLDELVEWELKGSSKVVTTNYYHVFNETYSRVDWSIYVKRNPTFFLDKIVSGVAMLVVMSWCLFTLDVMDSNRHTTAATTFLAVVTYLFIISGDVPKVSYTTRLGQFITLSMMEIFFSYIIFSINIGITRNATQALENAKVDRAAEKKKKKKTEVKPMTPPTATVYDDPADENGKTAQSEDDGTPTKKDAFVTVKADEADEDEEDPEGWWTVWAKVRPAMELVCVTLLVLVYVVATPVLLRHVADAEIPEHGKADAHSGGGGGH